jgi:hypothetical protein
VTWGERLLRILGIQARVRAEATSRESPVRRDPELARVRSIRVGVEAELDLLKLEAENLGVDRDDADTG